MCIRDRTKAISIATDVHINIWARKYCFCMVSNVNLSFCAPEQKNFTYMKSLGSYYSEENVRIRLAKNRSKVKAPKHLSREARLYINISTYVTTGNREGFERWAKLNNLKEAARTFNYLSENNLLNYEDFKMCIRDSPCIFRNVFPILLFSRFLLSPRPFSPPFFAMSG